MTTTTATSRLREIEQIASDVLAAHEVRSLPVDLAAIASAEEIALLPGDYDGCFDGRIEYRRRPQGGSFYLFHAAAQPGVRTPSRVRFSIGHELGHYFLPEHRAFLLSGQWHGSHSDFVSSKPTEREADAFASCLLMPEKSFTAEVAKRSGRVCSLQELATLAETTFGTSVTSTALRYAALCYEACAVVLSRKGQVLYSVASEDMRLRGLGWIPAGARVPPTTASARVGAEEALDHAEAQVDAEVWFGKKRGTALWEDALRLGHTGLVLTLLAAPDDAED